MTDMSDKKGYSSTARFRIFRETRGTYLYREVDPASNILFPQYGAQGALIGALYVRKDIFKGAGSAPEELTVTLNWL
jgi:hypothetical protein